MYFEEILPDIDLESKNIEFKATLEEGENPKDNSILKRLEYGWLKAVNAFANTMGGTLFVGVEDKTHRILSLTPAEVDKVSLRFHRLIKEHIHPDIDYEIRPINVAKLQGDEKGRHENRYILEIRIAKSSALPVTLHADGFNFIFVRYFGKNAPATPEQIRSLSLLGDNASFDLSKTARAYDPNDFQLLRETYQREQGKELSEKSLIDVKFMDKDGLLSRGALLFLDGCADERTLLIAMKIKGTTKGADYFYQSQEIKGNLIRVLQEAEEFVLRNSANGFQKTPSGTVDYVAYPFKSLREGIANAIVHRNYFLDGTQIELNLYEDRLELISPGSYPLGENIDEQTDIASIAPGRRNEVLCGVFALLGYVNKKGSGFDTISEEYRGKGESFRPYVVSTPTHFTLTLPDLTHSMGLVERNEMPEIEPLPLVGNPKQYLILRYCYNKPRNAAEIADKLGIKASSYFRKELLESLIKIDVLRQDDSVRPAKYSTNRAKVFAK